jgi:tetratricopeptide (TPR) repeat protein
MSQTAISIVQYLEYYNSMWKDLMAYQHEYSLQEYAQRSVLTTWRISYEQVKSQNEGASNLLQLWSFLYAGDLWYELFSSTEDLVTWNVVPDWLKVLAQNRLAFDNAIRLLIKFSLIEAKEETASYAMHSVLHSWCRYLGESETERNSFQKLALEIVGCLLPEKSTKEYWILQRRLLPHGQALFDSTRSRTQTEMDPLEVAAYNSLAGMFTNQDRYSEAEAMYERALAGSEKTFGPKDLCTLKIVSNLGVLYRTQGRLVEAETMYERALAGKEKALGPTHTFTLGIVNNLGVLYYNQGRFKEAEAMYKRALAKMEKALGPTHTSTLDIVQNLGILYRAQDRFVKAEAMYERALAGKEKALGPTHTSTLDIVHNLGILYSKQGRLVEAKAMLKRALAGYEQALGPEHTSTLGTARSLANLDHNQGLSQNRESSTESTPHDGEVSESDDEVGQLEQLTKTQVDFVSRDAGPDTDRSCVEGLDSRAEHPSRCDSDGVCSQRQYPLRKAHPKTVTSFIRAVFQRRHFHRKNEP